MDPGHTPRDEASSPTTLLEINRICDRFEAEWRAGGRPSLESQLAGAQEPSQSALLKELLATELECRRSAGERPGPAEYRARFPGHVAIIEAAFAVIDDRLQRETPGAAARPAESDRNLLFGVLALQMDFITRDALGDAMNAWLVQKHRALGEILEERGALAPADRCLLEPLVLRHIQQHGNDPARSLTALSSRPTLRAALDPVKQADPDLQQSLDRLSRTEAPFPRAEGPRTTAQSLELGGPRFRILRLHDRGGLGEVFVARDVELSREVAYKQIRSEHAAHAQSRARFMQEAEITGGLEHPGIVPVYGLGVDNADRPFYAMRFIKGDSLKDAIVKYRRDEGPGRDPGERALALRGLLGRFLDVCNAVAYAHSRGVLHRDLKPGNVMLGPYGETLVVDWGLAKVIGLSDSGAGQGEATLRPPSGSGLTPTVSGEACGTPAYMSPEQAAGRPEDLGPASDVYSLGATLYCLLTGRAPFEGEVGDVLRAVERGAFPPPRALEPAINPALEAVVLKAMALKPADRYATPRALAEDVERWLADEPVSAWREPLVVRARRWLGRHRTRVAAGLAAVIAAGLAGVAMAVLLVWAVMAVEAESNRRLRVANAELLKSQAQRDSAHAGEVRALQRARQRFALALEAVRRQHSGASEDVLLKEPQLEGLRRSLLGSALEFYRQLQGLLEDDPDPEARAELAGAYVAVGRITSEIGSKTDALEAFRRSLELYEALAQARPAEAKYREGWAEALADHGDVLGEMGRRTEAVVALEQALRLLEPIEATDLAPGRLRRRMAWAHQQIGVIRTTDRPTEGLGPLLRARAIWGSLVAADPADARNLASMASVYQRLGYLQQAINQPEEAVRSYREGIGFAERALRSAPKSAQDENLLAKLHLGLGFAYTSLGRADEAQAACRRALEILEALVRTNPSSTSYRHSFVLACNNVGYDLSTAGRTVEALRTFERGLTVLEKLAAENPSVARYATDVALLHCNIGGLHRKDGRPSEALSSLRRGLVSLERGPEPEAWGFYLEACLLAQCGALAAEFPRAFSDQERAYLAGSRERAMAALRQAIDTGFRMASVLQREEDFAALRSRPDFQALVLDLDFPADPFGP
jgi:serine/threonine-protein kinase